MPDIKNDFYDVCVVGGLGHVGLPLGITMANVGKKVVLYDVDRKAIEVVSSGKVPFVEIGAEPLLNRNLNKSLFISSDKKVISQSHFVIVVIGTPVDEHLNPKFTIFKDFFDGLVDEIRDGQHVILRSTVFPGTAEKIMNYLSSKGKKVKVSFCPERIAEGKAMGELRTLPQIIASFDEESFVEAEILPNFYEAINPVSNKIIGSKKLKYPTDVIFRPV